MSNLAQAIAAAHEVNLKKLTATVHRPEQRIGTDAAALFHEFGRWCGERGVSALPCAPAVVAAWLTTEGKRVGRRDVKLTLSAIERVHFAHGLANPVQCPEVMFALGELCPHELPHWKDRDRELFGSLPDEIQRAILIRENQRDRWLRNKMNELAELKKQLTDGNAVTTKEKVENQ